MMPPEDGSATSCGNVKDDVIDPTLDRRRASYYLKVEGKVIQFLVITLSSLGLMSKLGTDALTM